MNQPDADVPCSQLMGQFKAKCCTFIFALTKGEVKKGLVKYNKDKPYFIARDMDGYCPHLNRDNLNCEVWNDRPLRCRRYDCRGDRNAWTDGFFIKI